MIGVCVCVCACVRAVCVCVVLCLCVHKNETLAADRPNNERQTTIYLVYSPSKNVVE